MPTPARQETVPLSHSILSCHAGGVRPSISPQDDEASQGGEEEFLHFHENTNSRQQINNTPLTNSIISFNVINNLNVPLNYIDY